MLGTVFKLIAVRLMISRIVMRSCWSKAIMQKLVLSVFCFTGALIIGCKSREYNSGNVSSIAAYDKDEERDTRKIGNEFDAIKSLKKMSVIETVGVKFSAMVHFSAETTWDANGKQIKNTDVGVYGDFKEYGDKPLLASGFGFANGAPGSRTRTFLVMVPYGSSHH